MQLSGVIHSLVFHNPQNGYSVIRLRVEGERDPVTIVGKFPELTTGELLKVEGKWVEHPQYGSQLTASHYQVLEPDDPSTIAQYLASGIFKGIGTAHAQKIVRAFGKQTFSVLDQTPEKLNTLSGFGKKKAQSLLEQWNQKKNIRKILYFLQSHQLSPTLSQKIYKQYGEKAVEVLTDNPYQLAEDLFGIGFRKADEVAKKLGIDPQSFKRIDAGISYCLARAADEGHVFLPREELMQIASQVLECPPELIIYTLDHLADNSDIKKDDENCFYRPYLFHTEKGIARRLGELARFFSPPEELDTWIANLVRTQTAIQYSSEQIEGIRKSLSAGLFLLTGGPGTGKTTTLLGILRVMQNARMNVLLTAPTGRAAKRMAEVTRFEAKTIHRLLKYDPSTRGFFHGEHNPLEADAIIVDELSMVDSVLFYSLIRAVQPGTRLVMVGDPDQLPSVGPGKVLSQLIESNTIAHLHLSQIFRQAEESAIVRNAHRINQGLKPEFPPKGSNCHFRSANDTDSCLSIIRQLITIHLPKHFGYHPLHDIQILTPMNRGALGTETLNTMLQAELNQQAESINHKNREFKVGDKIMQIRNNYDKGVFNGDIGYILSVDRIEKIILAGFDDLRVSYSIEELDQLNLAYAVTIHKSQGSEFRAVIMALTNHHWVMLQRNLFYTAITRAKERVFIVGQPFAIQKAVENNPIEKRFTKLSEKLKMVLPQSSQPETRKHAPKNALPF